MMRIQRRQFLHMAASAVALPALSRAAAAQTTRRSSRERLEEALSRIADPKGEGARACLTVYSEASRAAADAADARARVGVTLGPLDGAILNIKDLFDVAGEPTRAGSKLLAEEAMPAMLDAPVVRRLRAAGAIIAAKNNMSEFRRHHHWGKPAVRNAGQSSRSSEGPWRVIVGRSGCGRGRHVRDCNRFRHRRISPCSGRVVRHRRL
jgi:hypothetical protein